MTKKIESVRTLNTCKISRLSRKSGNYAIQNMDPEEKEDKMMYTKRRLLNDSTTLLFSE